MKKTYIAILLLVMISHLFTGCFNYDVPPDINSVQQRFQNYDDSIQMIVDYMICTGYENIYISDTNGTMFADLEERPIDEEAVIMAINQLLGKDVYLRITKRGNSIWFSHWEGVRDVGCGIAYTINGVDFPEVSFATEMIPLQEKGWFYYMYDYNAWRIQYGTN